MYMTLVSKAFGKIFGDEKINNFFYFTVQMLHKQFPNMKYGLISVSFVNINMLLQFVINVGMCKICVGSFFK